MAEKKRKLYKIGHLAELLDVSLRTIRYYDQMGLLPHVKRSDGNVRLFDDEDIEIISRIRRMQKEEFLPLEVIKDRLFEKKKEKVTDSVVITDSTAAIPKDIQEKLNIQMIPLKITLDGKEYKDNVNITTTAFWEKLKTAKSKPFTSPPTVEEFEAYYLDLHKKGFKTIYSIHISSKMSETSANAETAAKRVSDRVTVVPIDSKSTGAGLGLFVKQVAEAVHNGDSSREIKLLISKQLPLIFYLVSVNSLKYLLAGGYLNASATPQNELFSRLVEFKPVFTVRPVTGEIDILRCCKLKTEALELMYDLLLEEFEARRGYVDAIMINYNYLYGEALDLVNQIKRKFPNTPVYLEEGCAVLSAYVGPETISISIA